MVGRRPSVLYTLLTAVGTYLFFALQFFVDSASSFRLLIPTLKFFHINPETIVNKPLVVAIFFSMPYVAIVFFCRIMLFDYYARLTIEHRLLKFHDSIKSIKQYHSKNISDEVVEFLKKGKSGASIKRIHAISNTMIDLLITDLRDAFQELCLSSDIRIAVYIAGYPVGSNRSSPVLYMRNTTQFDINLDYTITFQWKPGTMLFEGFCGKAWHSESAEGGASKIHLFKKNPDFKAGTEFDESRSFLALPILGRTATGLKAVAVLCVDSERSIDFKMKAPLRNKIHALVSELNPFLVKYVKWPEA